MEQVVLVDKEDNKKDLKEKIQAHKDGDLHRAFSVFIFNENEELLLQQRAEEKYHSGGLWSNTCCSHPRYEKSILKEGEKRLNEELGIESPELSHLFSFRYKTELENEIIEHELDHVLAGKKASFEFDPDPKEVQGYQWKTLNEVGDEIKKQPNKFTSWFKIIMNDYEDHLNKYLLNL